VEIDVASAIVCWAVQVVPRAFPWSQIVVLVFRSRSALSPTTDLGDTISLRRQHLHLSTTTTNRFTESRWDKSVYEEESVCEVE